MDWGNLEGLIPIFAGVYGFLLANGNLPKNPKDPEKMELWRRKFGPLMKLLCPFLVGFGVLLLTGVL